MPARKTVHKHVKDVKVTPGEENAKQHHLLVFDFRADIPSPAEEKFPRLVPQGARGSIREPKGLHHKYDLKQCQWQKDRWYLGKTEVQSTGGSWKCVHIYQETPVAKRDLVVECDYRQCSGQTCCLSSKTPGKARSPLQGSLPRSSGLFCLANQIKHKNLDVQDQKPVCKVPGRHG